MKPQLLMLLLLAIPPLVANILACENAEKTDTPPAAKSDSIARETPTPTTSSTRAVPAVAPAPAAPAAPAAKSVPAHSTGSGSSTGLKAWFIM